MGCGPGTVTRSLGRLFTTALGIDAGESMISTARSLGGLSASGEPIRFEVSSAEDLGAHLGSHSVQDGSVDLITTATAAHWFDMPSFWRSAARVLKPGGTVAIWSSAGPRVSPSTPKAEEIQAAMGRLMQSLDAYMEEGNRLNHELYVRLPLPWTVEPAVPEFDEASYVRKEWGTGEGSEPADQFYASGPPVDLDMVEKIMSTASPVVRWRESHPEMVGTEGDVVRVTRREIEGLLHQAGVEPGKERLYGGSAGVLMMVKKKKI